MRCIPLLLGVLAASAGALSSATLPPPVPQSPLAAQAAIADSTDADQADTPQVPVIRRAAVPVIFRGDTVRTLEMPLGGFTAPERAAAMSRRLAQLAAIPRVDARVTLEESDSGTNLVLDDVVITTVSEQDATTVGTPRRLLAADYAARAEGALARSPTRGLTGFARGAVETVIAFVLLLALFLALSAGFNRLYNSIESGAESWVPTLRIQRLVVLSEEQLTQGLLVTARVARVLITLFMLFFFVPLVLSFFPATEVLSGQLVDGMFSPIRQVWWGVLNYVPSLVRVLVILAVTFYALKLVHLIFDGLRTGRLRFRGFYPDWAEPSYQIVRFLVLAFALILIWPYLPGSDSAGFKGVAAFVGLLITFGSASAISNMIGGVVLTYMRPFQVGDRVQISDTTGDVIEKGLLVTRIRTVKNVNVTIPNSMVLGHHLINYSRAAKREGVILHTTVTLGYDAPWPAVHEALLEAARGTDGVMNNPEPFVLQSRLDDFYVAYELNVYTREPNRMSNIYSDLHRNIQDACNAAGIEILSPHFRAARDGNALQVPPPYLENGYEAPSFRVDVGGDKA